MYTVRASYGYVDETETIDIIGTYETWDGAADVALDKFRSIMDDLRGDTDTCYGEMEGSQYDYYVTDGDPYVTGGDHCVEVGRVFSGPDYYCDIAIVER